MAAPMPLAAVRDRVTAGALAAATGEEHVVSGKLLEEAGWGQVGTVAMVAARLPGLRKQTAARR